MRRQNSTSSKSEIIKEIIKAEEKKENRCGRTCFEWVARWRFFLFSFFFPKMMKCGNKFPVRLGKAQWRNVEWLGRPLLLIRSHRPCFSSHPTTYHDTRKKNYERGKFSCSFTQCSARIFLFCCCLLLCLFPPKEVGMKFRNWIINYPCSREAAL